MADRGNGEDESTKNWISQNWKEPFVFFKVFSFSEISRNRNEIEDTSFNWSHYNNWVNGCKIELEGSWH